MHARPVTGDGCRGDISMYWLEFFISAVVIVLAGTTLTVCADKLSDRLRLGKVWIGVVLLGVVTSLPEAVASLTAIVSLRADDLAVGNLLGSNNFNPMLIVMMDALYRQGALTDAVHPGPSHKISAVFAILLTVIVIADIMFNAAFPVLHAGPLSLGGVLIALCYFAGMRRLARLGTGQSVIARGGEQAAVRDTAAGRMWIQLLISAVLVVGGAIWLAKSAEIIADQTGLGMTFVGSIFLAFVTSLPETVVSLSALRLGSLDLAIGNIFGSNMTNMFILFVCGLFRRGGPLVGAVSRTHIVTAVLGILLTFVAVVGIFSRKGKKTALGFGWDSLIMTFLFIAGTTVLYLLKP